MTEIPQPKHLKHVRIATPDDEGELFRILSEKLYLENACFKIDPISVMETIKKATRGHGGIIGVIDGDGEIAGSVGMNISKFWYTSEWMVEELFNFVQVQYRRSNYAKDLIDYAKWVSERFGLVLNMGIMSNHRTEAKVRLYQRRLQPMGQFFMHNVKVAGGPIGQEFREKV